MRRWAACVALWSLACLPFAPSMIAIALSAPRCLAQASAGDCLCGAALDGLYDLLLVLGDLRHGEPAGRRFLIAILAGAIATGGAITMMTGAARWWLRRRPGSGRTDRR